MKKVEAPNLVMPKPKTSGTAKSKKKKVWTPKDYKTAIAAQPFKPPHPECYLSLETEWHPRWEISYPCRFPSPPYSFSSPYDPVKPATKRAAVSLALQWAWQEHEAQGHCVCPYEFEEN